MKITVWGINYAPELTGISPYNTDLCEFLAAQGHEVRMVSAFPYYPAWKKRPADRGRLWAKEQRNGVDLYRTWHYVPHRPTALKRILHEASFIAASFIRQLFLPRPDVLVVVSPPLGLGPAAWLLGVLKRCPFHFHVQDIQPDAALGLGLLQPGKVASALYAIEAFTYRRAHSISGITEGMLELFSQKGVPPGKQFFFPNWTPELPDKPEPRQPSVSFRNRWDIPRDDFLVVYSGNLGKKQGLEIIIEAAGKLHEKGHDEDLQIVIAGDGGEKADLERAIARRPLPVRLLPLQPDELFRSMLDEADLFLVTQQPGAGSLFFPSKVLTLLRHACPIVSVADEGSELRRAVRNGRFGECVAPGEPEALAEAIVQLRSQPERRKALGEAGREWVKQFSRTKVLGRFEKFLRAHSTTADTQRSMAEESRVLDH